MAAPNNSSFAATLASTADRQSSEWLNCFGLTVDPFSEDNDVFYKGAHRAQHLATLRHLLHYSDQVLLLTGSPGSGKSTILKQLLREEEGFLHAVVLEPDTPWESDRLIQALAVRLHGKTSIKDLAANLPKEISAYSDQIAEQGLRVVMVIQHAHLLSEKAFDLLVSCFGPLVKQGRLGLLLVAEPAISQACARLSAKIDADDWFYGLELQPFTHKESEEYIQFRLSAAGWSGKPGVPAADLNRLVSEGRGNPARINQNAAKCLLGKASLPAKAADAPSTYWHWIIFMAVLLVGSFALVAYQYRKDPPAKDQSVSSVRSSEIAPEIRLRMAEDPVLLDLTQVTQPEVNASVEMVEEADPVSLPISSGNPDASEALESQGQSSADVAVLEDSSTAATSSQPPSLTKVDEVGALVTSPEQEAILMDQDILAGRSKSDLVTDSNPSVPPDLPAEESPVSARANQETAEEPDELVSESKVPKEKAVSTQVSVDKPYYKSRAWLMQQPRDRYTVQLLASFNEETALNFIRSLPNSSEYLYISSVRKGQDWFVVMRGSYPNLAAAKDAVEEFPAPVKKQRPWIRKFKGLQEEAQAGG